MYKSPGAKEALQGQNKEDGCQRAARSDFENDSCNFRREFGVEHLNQGSGDRTHTLFPHRMTLGDSSNFSASFSHPYNGDNMPHSIVGRVDGVTTAKQLA